MNLKSATLLLKVTPDSSTLPTPKQLQAMISTKPGQHLNLPARLEEWLKQDPKLQELQAEMRLCPRVCPIALEHSKQLLASYWSDQCQSPCTNIRRSRCKTGGTGRSSPVGRSNTTIFAGPTWLRVFLCCPLDAGISRRNWHMTALSRRQSGGSPWSKSFLCTC